MFGIRTVGGRRELAEASIASGENFHELVVSNLPARQVSSKRMSTREEAENSC